jgi:hypothetical protein
MQVSESFERAMGERKRAACHIMAAKQLSVEHRTGWQCDGRQRQNEWPRFSFGAAVHCASWFVGSQLTMFPIIAYRSRERGRLG